MNHDNSESAVKRARDQVIELITNSQTGDRLPGERELSQRIGVARMTLRRAIETLIIDGLIERRPGSGTFTTRPIIAAEMRLASFSEEMRSKGLSPSTRIVSLRKIASTVQVATKLRIPEGEEVYQCTRLRLADNQPIALETLHIPTRYVSHLNAADLEDSLYEALFKNYKIRIVEAKTLITAITPNKSSAALLEIDTKTPCLQVNMIDRDQSGRVVMIAKCIYRGDRYEVQLEATGRTVLPVNKIMMARNTRNVS